MNIFDKNLENEILAIAINNDEAKDMFEAILISSDVFYYEIHVFISEELRKSSTSLKIKLLKKLKGSGRFQELEITGFRFDYFEIRGYKEKCYLLLELYAKRVALECSDLIIKGITNEKDIFNIRSEVFLKLESIDSLVKTSSIKPISEVIEVVQEEAKFKHESDDLQSGIKTHLKDLDKITGGFQNSDLIILAGRPSMGKTALMLTIARNVTVINKDPVAVFSLEMSCKQLVERLVSSESGVNAMIIKNGVASNQSFDKWNNSADNLKPAPLYLDDTAGLKLVELRSKVRKLVKEKDVKLVIIDYLQLMSGNGRGNREQEISEISRGLKIIAKENDIPIIALSQLSRSVESRGGDKRPMLSDLRESGAIEQDADIVAFVYRAEYYGITQDEEGNSTEGVAELIISKHRSGALGSPEFKFIPSVAKFENIEEFEDFKPDKFIEPNNEFDNDPF